MGIRTLAVFLAMLAGAAVAEGCFDSATADPAAAAPVPAAPGDQPQAGMVPWTVHYRAVLAAGNGSIPNFDNAVLTLANRLERSGAETKLLTSDSSARTSWRSLATAHQIDVLFNQMEPGPGEGCLVFVTSHGSVVGLQMTADIEEDFVLTPERLSGILTRHCGDAPTVAVLSGCHSGTYVTPVMERENRIIITAARKDRTSFGCSSDYAFTYFDECLLEAMGDAGTWQSIFARTKTCVNRKEGWFTFKRSLPQAYFGAKVAALALE
jgi:hypothetical protein